MVVGQEEGVLLHYPEYPGPPTPPAVRVGYSSGYPHRRGNRRVDKAIILMSSLQESSR